MIAYFDPFNLLDKLRVVKPLKEIPESTRRAIASFEVEERYKVTKEMPIKVITKKVRWLTKTAH